MVDRLVVYPRVGLLIELNKGPCCGQPGSKIKLAFEKIQICISSILLYLVN